MSRALARRGGGRCVRARPDASTLRIAPLLDLRDAKVQCTSMKARLVSMGNSRGVRLPKPLIEQVGLGDEVELTLQNGGIFIAPVHVPRAGWAEAAAQMTEGLLDNEVSTHFDESEWQW